MPVGLKVRLIQEIGTRAWLRGYWGGSRWDEKAQAMVPDNPCPGNSGPTWHGCHSAKIHLMDSDKRADWQLGGRPEDYPDDRWPTRCEACGQPIPPEGIRQILRRRLYNTASGDPEPGDMYWAPWYHEEDKRHLCPWDNCNDSRGHLIVVLPNGHEWDIDSRASNCTMKEDRTHRCWVRHGEPPAVHVDKAGHTCQAGAGSIGVPGYHGYLHNGELTGC